MDEFFKEYADLCRRHKKFIDAWDGMTIREVSEKQLSCQAIKTEGDLERYLKHLEPKEEKKPNAIRCSKCDCKFDYMASDVVYDYEFHIKGVPFGKHPGGCVLNGVTRPREWQGHLCDYCFHEMRHIIEQKVPYRWEYWSDSKGLRISIEDQQKYCNLACGHTSIDECVPHEFRCLPDDYPFMEKIEKELGIKHVGNFRKDACYYGFKKAVELNASRQ